MWLREFVVVVQLRFELVGGVIPKPRAFTSGAKDLAWSLTDFVGGTREIPPPPEEPALLGMTPRP